MLSPLHRQTWPALAPGSLFPARAPSRCQNRAWPCLRDRVQSHLPDPEAALASDSCGQERERQKRRSCRANLLLRGSKQRVSEMEIGQEM